MLDCDGSNGAYADFEAEMGSPALPRETARLLTGHVATIGTWAPYGFASIVDEPIHYNTGDCDGRTIPLPPGHRRSAYIRGS